MKNETTRVFSVSCDSCGFNKEAEALSREDACTKVQSDHANHERNLLIRCKGERRRLVATSIAKFSCD